MVTAILAAAGLALTQGVASGQSSGYCPTDGSSPPQPAPGKFTVGTAELDGFVDCPDSDYDSPEPTSTTLYYETDGSRPDHHSAHLTGTQRKGCQGSTSSSQHKLSTKMTLAANGSLAQTRVF